MESNSMMKVKKVIYVMDLYNFIKFLTNITNTDLLTMTIHIYAFMVHHYILSVCIE